jgi:hypothetical protein
MTVQRFLLGVNAKLYAGTAGSTPNTEIDDATDVAFDINTDLIDVTTRAAKGWKVYTHGLKEAEISFTLLAKENSTQLALFLNAFNNNTPLAILTKDDPTASLAEFESDCIVSSCNKTEELADAIKYEVKLKPTIYDKDRVPTLTINS